jgi:hypothetical protein
VTPYLSPRQLQDLARTGPSSAPAIHDDSACATAPCERCAPLHCPGWESLPAGFDEASLRVLGTLREPQADPDHLVDPTWAEHHPQGTRIDSARAPIAPAFHPYNRCDLHACVGCGRLFLRYTEGGGYYVDPRIRAFDAGLLVV